jgi:hypothetical protein
MGANSISESQKTEVRAILFHHLAGIILAPTIKALADRKVFELFHSTSIEITLDEIVERTRGNRGYLRVALRLLASCGWMRQTVRENGRQVSYSLTREGVIGTSAAPALCAEILPFLPKAIYLEDFLFGGSGAPALTSLPELIARSKDRWSIASQSNEPETNGLHEQITRQIDGLLVGPAMVALARSGIIAQLEQGPVGLDTLSGNHASLDFIFDLLATQGWIVRDHGRISLTPCGRYAAQIASSYGVTVSYLPMFNVVSTLIFGNPRIPRFDDNGIELLVDRAMNVWGSGGAHRTYFKKVDEIIVELFNGPLDSQPKGICDMGCGDGSLLEHLYTVVQNHTARGKMLDQHPLIIIGADFNKVARRAAKLTLRRAGVPHCHIIHGDINRPALLAGDLEALGLDIHDLLHVRSFLDHNRSYIPPAGYTKGKRAARCTGAFAHFGQEILPDELEENLVRHLRRWAPYVGRFGLLVLELHTLPPELTAANLERTPAVAYDGTHGFSDQYLVELPIFLDCAREAGLQSDERFQAKFPASDLATVSMNFFTTAAR